MAKTDSLQVKFQVKEFVLRVLRHGSSATTLALGPACGSKHFLEALRECPGVQVVGIRRSKYSDFGLTHNACFAYSALPGVCEQGARLHSTSWPATPAEKALATQG